MRSVMNHEFTRVPSANIERSSFNRNHGHKTTFDAGILIPVLVDEALPGDTIKCKMDALARLATPQKPLMDNMFLESFFFAVPYRLVWDNWQKFNGERVDPDDDNDYTIPKFASHTVTSGSLSDYMGIPVGIPIVYNSLWHRAYNLIWNEWFRDQNMQDSLVVNKNDGDDAIADYVLQRRGKRHDYFTSCLPWPQKGPDVMIPLGDSAPVSIDGTGDLMPTWTRGANPESHNLRVISGSDIAQWDTAGGGTTAPALWDDPKLAGVADLTAATAVTLNALREAFQLQRLYERDARGGTRYIEIIKAHFGVTSPDARLQRPEYLGGGSSRVIVSPIAQTSATAAGATAQGNLAAMGVVAVNGHGFTKSFTEHCLILGLVCVRADLTYQQGLPRMFSRQTRFDFYWPALSHLGEQAVLNKEIYYNNDANDNLVFGYQERYAEYRYKQSQITGLFRSTLATPLDMWHLSQEFGSLPQLGPTFIEEDPPVDRVIAVPSEPHFIFDSYFEYTFARPMPVYGVPGMVDHF